MRCRIASLGASSPTGASAKWGSLDHAERAGRCAFEISAYVPDDVQMLVNTGVYRDKHYAEPAFACFIQKQLGINVEFQGREVLSFDLVNGGCGMLNAAQLIDTMLRAGSIDVGMVIASETNADRQPDPSWSYAPSGAALLLDAAPTDDQGFASFAFRTYEEHSELSSSVVSLTQKHGRLLLRKQEQLEATYLSVIPEAWNAALDEAGLSAEDIDVVCPSQVSPNFVAGLAGVLSVPADRIVDLTAQHPDTLTTAPFLAMAEARERGLLERGRTLAFLTVGSGITVGAAVYRV